MQKRLTGLIIMIYCAVLFDINLFYLCPQMKTTFICESWQPATFRGHLNSAPAVKSSSLALSPRRATVSQL